MNDNGTDIKGTMQSPTPEGFIGKPEVARRLGRTVRTVDTWMKNGILPYYKPDRRVLFRWTDIEQHIIDNYRVVGSKTRIRNIQRPVEAAGVGPINRRTTPTRAVSCGTTRTAPAA